jgi:alkylation response protein AidB-like acyl-CoA dehydrogenase
MDFEFDDEQLHLQTASAEVLAAECPPTRLRAVLAGSDDAAALWTTLCGLDWPGLTVPPEHGGSGASAVELAIVLEQLGYVADPTPFLATVTQLLPVVAQAVDADQRHRFLSGIAEGRTGTFAFADERGTWDPTTPTVSAVPHDDGWRLTGTAHWVLDGDRADEIAVLVSTAEGPRVVIVPGADAAASPVTCIDGSTHVSTVGFDDVVVAVDRMLLDVDGTAAFALALDDACAGMAMAIVASSSG